jgi:hypothetical protein
MTNALDNSRNRSDVMPKDRGEPPAAEAKTLEPLNLET